jgi:hypothetical protein
MTSSRVTTILQIPLDRTPPNRILLHEPHPSRILPNRNPLSRRPRHRIHLNNSRLHLLRHNSRLQLLLRLLPEPRKTRIRVAIPQRLHRPNRPRSANAEPTRRSKSETTGAVFTTNPSKSHPSTVLSSVESTYHLYPPSFYQPLPPGVARLLGCSNCTVPIYFHMLP